MARQSARSGARGFTLIEALVTVVLVTVAIVAALGGIGALSNTDAKARTALLLQRLAREKLEDLKIYADPSQAGSSGDYSDRGYNNIQWTADVEPTSIANVDQVTVTATRDKNSQAISTLIYIPSSTSTSSTTTSGASRAGTPATGGSAQ